jgi:dienelactone hydrolase
VRVALALAAAFVLAQASPASAAVLVVGDSLVVGTAPYLRQQLSTVVTSDGRIGRPSTEAVSVLRSKFSGQGVVVFDAGVNDDPAQPSRLSRDLAAARSIVGSRCLVVATMSRPPYNGVSVDGLNRAVRSFASSSPGVQLVDWRSAAVANPRLINSDGVHPTGAGYQLRARLFARAISACGTGGTGGGGGTTPPASGGLPPPGTPVPPGVPRPGRGRREAPVRPAPPKRHKPRKKAPPPRLGDQSPVLLDVPVTFRGLRGELIAPGGEGRHPAVVMLQGSGRATGEQYREQAEFLAEHGVGALIFDKRHPYDYADLAADARAAVALLRSRPEVRPDAIGLWGFSEGAYIAPMVAAGNPEVRAVMVVSPSGVAPASQEEWQVRSALDVSGAGAGAGAAVSRYYALASDLSSDLSFEPDSAWRRVSQPVLAVWGSADRVVPVHDSATALAGALAGGGANHDRVFRLFAGASHVLGVASESDRPGSAPGFKELSAQWLRDHLTGRPAPLISTPIARASAVGAEPVQRVSLLSHWPVQLAWLVLPAVALVALGLRLWRRRSAEDVPAAQWWWLAGVVGLDLVVLAALAFAVAAIVDGNGQGVAAAAGVPIVVLVAWAFTLAGVAASGVLARRVRRTRAPGIGVVLAGSAWLLLALYWLI